MYYANLMHLFVVNDGTTLISNGFLSLLSSHLHFPLFQLSFSNCMMNSPVVLIELLARSFKRQSKLHLVLQVIVIRFYNLVGLWHQHQCIIQNK